MYLMKQRNCFINKSKLSLSTQLYTLILTIVSISFIGSQIINIKTTRDYLNQQLQSHAQDTATSLGLSISPYMDKDNIVIAETMISAIFDSGYYQSIILTDLADSVIFSAYNDDYIEGVPCHFMNTNTLTAPIVISEINDDWDIVATLSVQANTGVSYTKLWQQTRDHFFLSLIISFISLLLAHYIIKAVLAPLARLEQQANAVCQKQFPLINNTAFTREISSVTTAMNNMVTNIQANFDELNQHAEKLCRQIYIDPLTELGNRKAFDKHFSHLQHTLSHDDQYIIGMVLLPSLNTINAQSGYHAGDEYIKRAVAVIQAIFKPIMITQLFRSHGGSLLFTIKSSDVGSIDICHQLNTQFTMLNSLAYSDGFANVIATSFTQREKLANLLANLDTLHTQEVSSNKQGIIYTNRTNSPDFGFQQWSHIIDILVANNEVELVCQPTVMCDANTPLYHEIFSQFLFEKIHLPNSQLFAMAERLNKSEALDKIVLLKLAQLNLNDRFDVIGINLTNQSLHCLEFRDWLTHFYAQNREKLPNLVFEVNEDAVLSSIESSCAFITFVNSLGIKVCIDHFGSSFTSFKYLKGLNIQYLKIDGSYIRHLDVEPENNAFIQAITHIAHSVGIKVLAAHIESKSIFNLIKELNCDAAQGIYIHKQFELAKSSHAMTYAAIEESMQP